MQEAGSRNLKGIKVVPRKKNKENYLKQEAVIKLREPFCTYLHKKQTLIFSYKKNKNSD